MILLIPAFLAGVLMVLAPCTLPILPGFVGFLLGSSGKTQGGRGVFRALVFVAGFMGVFLLFGGLAGFAGGFFGHYRLWLSRAGGVVLVLFGLGMLGFKPFSLERSWHLRLPKPFSADSLWAALLFGVVFGFGWTPCVGPILGTVLLLASTTGTALKGMLLLFVFSVGFSLPFLFIALFANRAQVFLTSSPRVLKIISTISALFIILIGILFFTASFPLWINWFFHVVRIFNYRTILNYL